MVESDPSLDQPKRPAFGQFDARGGWGPGAGYAMLVTSVVFNAAAWHTTCQVLKEISPLMLVVGVSVIAVAGFFAAGVLWRTLGWRFGGLQKVCRASVIRYIRKRTFWILLPPIAAAGAGWLTGIGQQRYGANVTAFLMNMTLVFFVLAGLLTGERIRRVEGVSVAVVIGGALLFNYKGGAVEWTAVGLMSLVCVGIAVKQMGIKQLSDDTPVPVVMLVTQCCTGLYCAIMLTFTEPWVMPSPGAWGLLAATALMCNIIGMPMLYSAYHVVGITRGGPFNALRPLGVLVISLILGESLPGSIQLVGATMILAGSAALSYFHGRRGAKTMPGPAAAEAQSIARPGRDAQPTLTGNTSTSEMS